MLAGLFRVVETIYGLTIRESKAEVWHPDVRFFTIRDASGATALSASAAASLNRSSGTAAS